MRNRNASYKETIEEMSLLHRPQTRRTGVSLLLFFLFLLVVPLVLTGCGPQYGVSDDPKVAMTEGETRITAADKAAKEGSKTEATRLYTDAAGYYGAVARKFSGKNEGLEASVQQIKIFDEKLENYQQAHAVAKEVTRAYPVAKYADTPAAQEVVTLHEDVIKKLDAQNSKTIYFKVMDTLVKFAGGSPVAAIVFIAVIVTVAVWPLRIKMLRSSREMMRFAPLVQKIQKKYKDDPMRAQQEVQELYKKHGVNMFAGCGPMLLQMPITLLMYQVIVHYQFHFNGTHFLWVNPAAAAMAAKWPFPLTGAIGGHLGEVDLLLLVVYTASMFLQLRFTPPSSSDPQAIEQQKVMSLTMPLMSFFFMQKFQVVSAFVLYWFISNIFSLSQQWYINRTLPKLPPVTEDDDASGAVIVADGAVGPAPAGTLTANPKLIAPKSRRKK